MRQVRETWTDWSEVRESGPLWLTLEDCCVRNKKGASISLPHQGSRWPVIPPQGSPGHGGMELSMKGRGPGPPWGTTQESVTSDLKQSILMIYTFSKPKQDGHGHRWPCAPLCVPSGLRLRAFQGDGSRRRDPEPPTRQPERSAVALGSAGRTCVPRAWPGYITPTLPLSLHGFPSCVSVSLLSSIS